ncbi:uncharacterized protein LOC125677737 [Ostrea edulis]|uniref:uncharacterized protein LOC125677737 n=1 Tax=Ostrea edulis TaxID=37623 RepID=UPI0024AE908E|nr:uncharacterized protein LOC125677737 [Ostrea edulis]
MLCSRRYLCSLLQIYKQFQSIPSSSSASVISLRTMSDSVHDTAKTGFVDGDNYDRFRPTYTDEVVKLIASIITGCQTDDECSPKYDCVELGAGTGKLTMKLIKELPKVKGYLATEPMDGFQEILRKNCPGIDTLVCSAEKMPVPSESVKAVVAAQCFHWFANMTSLNEINRILTPAGKLIMVWNNKDWKVPWVKDIEGILTRYYGDTPRAVSYKWKEVIEKCTHFRCVRHEILPGTLLKGREQDVIGHFCSVSVIASLEDDEKAKVRCEMKTILDRHGLTAGNDDIAVPFHTELYVCEKIKK